MLNDLAAVVQSLPDPVLEYGIRQDDQTSVVDILASRNDVTTSVRDRKLYTWNNVPAVLVDVCKKLGGLGPSGNWIYAPGDYQGWHTNSNVLGQRVYVSWASEDKQSGMKFFVDDAVIDSPDKSGWNIRVFNPPVWHMVYSGCIRASVGFIFERNLADESFHPLCLH